MNTIFFSQNVSIVSEQKITISYINRTDYNLQVTAQYKGERALDETVTYLIPAKGASSFALVEKSVPMYTEAVETGFYISPLVELGISSAPSPYIVMAEAFNVTDNSSFGTWNRGGGISPVMTSTPKTLRVEFKYNSGIYTTASVATNIPEDDGNYSLNIYNDVDQTGTSGFLTYGQQVASYGPIIGNGYTHYLELYGGDGDVRVFERGTNKGLYSLSEGLSPTNIGIIPSGYETFLYIEGYTPTGGTLPEPVLIDCDLYVCVMEDLNDRECAISVYGPDNTVLASTNYAPIENNWVAYNGGFRSYSPLRLNSVTKDMPIRVSLNGMEVSTTVGNSPQYVWIV